MKTKNNNTTFLTRRQCGRFLGPAPLREQCRLPIHELCFPATRLHTEQDATDQNRKSSQSLFALRTRDCLVSTKTKTFQNATSQSIRKTYKIAVNHSSTVQPRHSFSSLFCITNAFISEICKPTMSDKNLKTHQQTTHSVNGIASSNKIFSMSHVNNSLTSLIWPFLGSMNAPMNRAMFG
jgi:hypothetical protein